jgi:L-ascorbate metabolism protein UlaG (beta-lactamase superfamily)
MVTKPSISIDTSNKQPPTRDYPTSKAIKERLPKPKASKTHANNQSPEDKENNNASLFFVGTATTILEWEGLRLMTDPNFLHAGDHVHLGPGVTGTRRTNPAVDLHDLPPIDVVLLSHYHADHFDQDVEASLRRDLPIITTPHAQSCLASKGDGESFTHVHALDNWDNMFVDVSAPTTTRSMDDSTPSASPSSSPIRPRLRVEGMPGKHVGDGLLSKANDLLGAVPPTNGWMLELGYTPAGGASSFNKQDATISAAVDSPDFECGYRIYISGDTLYVSELAKIPELYTHAGKPIDLMLIHLGGTTIPGPHMPLLMVTMDAQQGVQLVKLVQPDVTVPIHYE